MEECKQFEKQPQPPEFCDLTDSLERTATTYIHGATMHSDDCGVDDDETANVTTNVMDSGDGCDGDGRMQNENILFSTESVAAGNDNEYKVSDCKRLSILDVCVIFDNDS